MPQVTFQAPAKLWIRHTAFHGPLARLGSTHYPPLLYYFCLFAHPPFLIPFPHAFHVSDIRLVSCSPPQTPFRTPNPKPRSVLLCITSPCSIFVPMFFCPNPCPFPLTLLCSFWYLYVNSFLYVPQSEINIDCPLWTSVRLIRTFQIHQNLRPSKLRTRERWGAKHQSLSRILVKPYCQPSLLVVPESFGLPCSVSVHLRLVSVLTGAWFSLGVKYISQAKHLTLRCTKSPVQLIIQTSKPYALCLKFKDSRHLVGQHISWSQVLTED